MANGYAIKSDNFRAKFMDKLLMGMTWPEYARQLITPFNIIAAIILSVGLPLIALRFVIGLSFVTHSSQEYPWGLYLGWGLFGGMPLSATGFVMATAYSDIYWEARMSAAGSPATHPHRRESVPMCSRRCCL